MKKKLTIISLSLLLLFALMMLTINVIAFIRCLSSYSKTFHSTSGRSTIHYTKYNVTRAVIDFSVSVVIALFAISSIILICKNNFFVKKRFIVRLIVALLILLSFSRLNLFIEIIISYSSLAKGEKLQFFLKESFPIHGTNLFYSLIYIVLACLGLIYLYKKPDAEQLKIKIRKKEEEIKKLQEEIEKIK